MAREPRNARGARGPTTGDLRAYFADLAREPRLGRDEESRLVRDLARGTAGYRGALYHLPPAARAIHARASARRSAGRGLRTLFEGGDGDAAGESCARGLDRLGETLVRRESVHSLDERRRLDETAADILEALHPTPALLRAVHRELRVLRVAAAAMGARAEGLGLPAAEFEARMEALEQAHDHVTAQKNRLIVSYLRLVVSVAKEFQHLGLPLADLVQEGNAGLIRAAERFDPERGASFTSFSVWWIRHGVLRAIQNHSRTVRVPSHHYDAARAERRVRARLERELGRAPHVTEVARALDLPVSRVDELLRCFADPVSLDGAGGDDGEAHGLGERLADPDRPDPAGEAETQELLEFGHRLLENLPARERAILCLRYGLDGEGERTLKAVGDTLGLSGERVRQLERDALARLRRRAGRALEAERDEG